MSLIIATGSNISDRLKHLNDALDSLSRMYELIDVSQVFESDAVDYTDQPSFYNQLLEFKIPNKTPLDVIDEILSLEKRMGRTRGIDKGPRIIDIDIIFWGQEKLDHPTLIVPHPSWVDRSFVVRPLQQLPFFKTIEKCFKIPQTFNVEAKPLSINKGLK